MTMRMSVYSTYFMLMSAVGSVVLDASHSLHPTGTCMHEYKWHGRIEDRRVASATPDSAATGVHLRQ